MARGVARDVIMLRTKSARALHMSDTSSEPHPPAAAVVQTEPVSPRHAHPVMVSDGHAPSMSGRAGLVSMPSSDLGMPSVQLESCTLEKQASSCMDAPSTLDKDLVPNKPSAEPEAMPDKHSPSQLSPSLPLHVCSPQTPTRNDVVHPQWSIHIGPGSVHIGLGSVHISPRRVTQDHWHDQWLEIAAPHSAARCVAPSSGS